jgi:hypothetical protein
VSEEFDQMAFERQGIFRLPHPSIYTPHFLDNPPPENRNRIFLADAVSSFFGENFACYLLSLTIKGDFVNTLSARNEFSKKGGYHAEDVWEKGEQREAEPA